MTWPRKQGHISRTKGRRPLKFLENFTKGLKCSYSKNQISSFKKGGAGHKTYLGGGIPPMCGRGLTFACCGGWDPSVFFQIVQKRQRAAPPFLAHLIIHLFRTCCENFRPSTRKVRSPGHVKWPHLIKSLNVRQRYTDWTVALTRALEGAYYAPHLFFANNLKTTAHSAAKFDIPAHNSWTHLVCKFWLPRSKGQVTRSGQSQMCPPGPVSNLKIVLWAQF